MLKTGKETAKPVITLALAEVWSIVLKLPVVDHSKWHRHEDVWKTIRGMLSKLLRQAPEVISAKR